MKSPDSPPSSLSISDDSDDDLPLPIDSKPTTKKPIRLDSDSDISLPLSSEEETITRQRKSKSKMTNKARNKALEQRSSQLQKTQTKSPTDEVLSSETLGPNSSITLPSPNIPSPMTPTKQENSHSEHEVTSSTLIPKKEHTPTSLPETKPNTIPLPLPPKEVSNSFVPLPDHTNTPTIEPHKSVPDTPNNLSHQNNNSNNNNNNTVPLPMTPEIHTPSPPTQIQQSHRLSNTSEHIISPVPLMPRDDSELEGDTRIRQLVDLLDKATQQVKSERARAKELEKENEVLKHSSNSIHGDVFNITAEDELVALRHQNMVLRQTCENLTKKAAKVDNLKQKYRELLLENQLAVEQIAVLRLKCIDMQVALEGEKAKIEQITQNSAILNLSTHSAHEQINPNHVIYNKINDERNRSRDPSPKPKRQAAQSQLRAPSNPSTQHPFLNGNGHMFNAIPMSSPPTALPFSIMPTPSSSPSPLRTSRSSSPSLQPQRRPTPPRSNIQSDNSKDQVLIHRMIRALSPPPSTTQMAKLVDSMMKELQRNLQSRGVGLPLKRVGDCVYSLGNKKLNMSVVSDKLVVKVGGGHQDFLEYLQKAKFHKVERRNTGP